MRRSTATCRSLGLLPLTFTIKRISRSYLKGSLREATGAQEGFEVEEEEFAELGCRPGAFVDLLLGWLDGLEDVPAGAD